MSHDRGCACGREKDEYESCDNRKCLKKSHDTTPTYIAGTGGLNKKQLFMEEFLESRGLTLDFYKWVLEHKTRV